jgi:hypothetical protein
MMSEMSHAAEQPVGLHAPAARSESLGRPSPILSAAVTVPVGH